MIWPTGYYGSYIHWLISRSETDLSKNTVDNPFFNNGSSHAHIKNPPHQTIENLIQSTLRNRYPNGTIYPIGITSNVSYNGNHHNWMKSFENSFFWILRIENEPIVINIYNGHNEYYTKLAAINMYHKENWVVESTPDDDGYYVFQDQDKLRARNYLVDNWKNIYPYHDQQLTTNTVDLYREAINKGVQHRYDNESWEYNKEDNWIHATGKYLYNIKLEEILSENFINILQNILNDSKSGNFDLSQISHVHLEFLEKQKKYRNITNELYNQATDLIYRSHLSDNILYEALAIDILKNEIKLPKFWHSLTLKEIIERLNDKRK